MYGILRSNFLDYWHAKSQSQYHVNTVFPLTLYRAQGGFEPLMEADMAKENYGPDPVLTEVNRNTLIDLVSFGYLFVTCSTGTL